MNCNKIINVFMNLTCKSKGNSYSLVANVRISLSDSTLEIQKAINYQILKYRTCVCQMGLTFLSTHFRLYLFVAEGLFTN